MRASEGSAQIHQTLVLAEALRLFRADRRLQPSAGVAAGVYHLRGDGTGTSSLFPGVILASTAAAFGVEGGVAARLGRRISLLVDASALVIAPSTSIRIAGREVARAGGLGVLGTASLCGVF